MHGWSEIILTWKSAGAGWEEIKQSEKK